MARFDFREVAVKFVAAVQSAGVWLQTVATNVRRLYLQYAQNRYDETRNPLFAWNVYRQQRLAGEPIPDWVLAYLIGCRQTSMNFKRKRGGASTSKIRRPR